MLRMLVTVTGLKGGNALCRAVVQPKNDLKNMRGEARVKDTEWSLFSPVHTAAHGMTMGKPAALRGRKNWS